LSAGRVTLCGYTPAQRKAYVDKAMADFHTQFGFYPTTISMWSLDTYSVNYAHSAYGVNACYYCCDQLNTDQFILQGWPSAFPYEGNSDYAYMPANGANRSGVAMFRICIDRLNNIGWPGTGKANLDLDAFDSYNNYNAVGIDLNYWTELASELCRHPPDFNCLLSNNETGFAWGQIGPWLQSEAEQSVTMESRGLFRIVPVNVVAAAFLAQPTAQRDYPRPYIQLTDPLNGTQQKRLEVVSPNYRAVIRALAGNASSRGAAYLGMTGLFCYPQDLSDPYLNTALSGQVSTQEAPWIVDGTQYSQPYASTPGAQNYQLDTLANNACAIRVAAMESGGTIGNDDWPSGSAGYNAILNLVLPDLPGEKLTWTRGSQSPTGGLGYTGFSDQESMEFRAGGIIVSYVFNTGNGTSVFPGVIFGLAPAADPFELYCNTTSSTSSGVTNIHANATGTNTVTTVSGIAWAAMVSDNRDAALVVIPVPGGCINNGGTATVTFSMNPYGEGITPAASIYSVQSNNDQCSIKVALIPCSANSWQTTVANALANLYSVLGPAVTMPTSGAQPPRYLPLPLNNDIIANGATSSPTSTATALATSGSMLADPVVAVDVRENAKVELELQCEVTAGVAQAQVGICRLPAGNTQWYGVGYATSGYAPTSPIDVIPASTTGVAKIRVVDNPGPGTWQYGISLASASAATATATGTNRSLRAKILQF
jgi:hypothetical protein